MTQLNPTHVVTYAVGLLQVLEWLQQLSPEEREEVDRRMNE